MKVRDLVKPGETAVAIFTRGGRFVVQSDGRGYTGNWVINPGKRLNKVIIYKRDQNGTQNEIYVGTPIEIIEPEESGRRKIEMADIKFAGTTTLNWNEFTETRPGAVNPIKYISDCREKATQPSKNAYTDNPVSSGSTITPTQLGDWRRAIIQLLNRIDSGSRTDREGVASRISRLSREGVLPREVAPMMHTITEMRNLTEYGSRTLSATEVAAVTAAWNAVQEWAQTRGLRA